MSELLSEVVIPVSAGILLASAAGFRAFLPLCVLGWLARFDLLGINLNDSFQWLASTPALIAFTSAVIIELAGDKFPAVDHFLDSIETFLKPIAGIIVVAAGFAEIDPLYAVIVGIVCGAPIATGVHIVKAKGRLLANLLTVGLAAPVLSFIEDFAALFLIVFALFLPLIGIGVMLVLLILLYGRKRAAA